MGLFKEKTQSKSYDATLQQPIIRASICNGEQVAGFKDIRTGEFEEIMLIRNAEDLDKFRKMYRIPGEIKKVY